MAPWCPVLMRCARPAMWPGRCRSPGSGTSPVRCERAAQPLADRHMDPLRAGRQQASAPRLGHLAHVLDDAVRVGDDDVAGDVGVSQASTRSRQPSSGASTTTEYAGPPNRRRRARSPRTPRGPGRRRIDSPASITPPGGVQSTERSRRRLATSTRPSRSTPPTRGINAPPTTQFLMLAVSQPLRPAPAAAAEVGDPQLEDDPSASRTMRPEIFDSPSGAVAERDRELDHLAADANDPVGHLDLEAVALGGDRVELHPLQRVGAVGAVARP